MRDCLTHGVVLMNKAVWHTAGDLVVPENLILVFLPPYSPDFNPIEILFAKLKTLLRKAAERTAARCGPQSAACWTTSPLTSVPAILPVPDTARSKWKML